jgi:hypothetical protein
MKYNILVWGMIRIRFPDFRISMWSGGGMRIRGVPESEYRLNGR